MLAHVMGECWHALVRDVIALGYTVKDIFTTLTLADMVSIVVAAPPGSSVRWYLDKGWTQEAHLLANMAEQQGGMARLEQPYQRPGIDQREQAGPAPGNDGFFNAEAITWEEMDRREAIRKSGNFKHGPSRARALTAVRSA